MDISEFTKADFSYYQRHPWEIARVKIIHHLIKKEEVKFEHLLDIGSGDAYILNELCLLKIADKYTAIDIAYDPEIIEKINLYNHCTISFLKSIPLLVQPRADLILLLDVLEHCKDETDVLKKIRDVAAPGCRLIITVPAFQSLFSKHDELLFHYRRYTSRQLRRLCESQQLNVEQAGYFFFSLVLIRGIQVFLEKVGLRRPDKTINNWRTPKWITSIYTSMLWLDFRIGRFLLVLGIRLPGLSAYCICRPSSL